MAVIGAVVATVVTGCSSGNGGNGLIGEPGGKASATPTKTTPPPKPKAKIQVTPANESKTLRWDDPVKVAASGGTLSQVTLTGADGKPIEGTMNPAKAEWTTKKEALLPSTKYEVNAKATNSEGGQTEITQTFTTAAPAKVLGTNIEPLSGMTVGVGMPLVIKFTAPVKDRATVQKRLIVETSKDVEGTWHWFTASEVHYRPRKYWPANTNVTLKINLKNVNSGNGAWGIRDKVKHFTIGRSVVTKVNLRTHFAKVYINGGLAKTIPVTGGKKGWETRDGTKLILERKTNINFKNQAIGAREEYNLTAPFGVRMTWSGEFLHSAPWSLQNLGKRNASHGCVGMSTPNSKWLFDNTKLGDPVEVSSTGPEMPVTGNGYGDWNLSWSSWKSGSAL